MNLAAESRDRLRARMAKIRQKRTRGELTVAAALRAIGVGYRLNVRGLAGSPDFANKSRKWAIFVNGCFWHKHTGCKRATIPKSNARFWREKFVANRLRDARAIRTLRRSGMRVMIIWGCEIDSIDAVRERLSKFLEPRRVDVPETVDH
jgi:DNA mismatch endonuclease Vsr